MDRRDILVPHLIFADAGRRSRLSGKASAIREAPTFGRRALLLLALELILFILPAAFISGRVGGSATQKLDPDNDAPLCNTYF